MAQKVEWTVLDKAAVKQLASLVEESGLTYRELSQRMGMQISFTRIQKALNEKNGPLRLSEFVYICQALGKDPAVELRKVLTEIGFYDKPQEEPDEEEKVKEILKNDLTLAAYEDPNKQREANGERY